MSNEARETIETDYLVVGAGAMGMAFTDTIVAESDASVVMVDRHHAPGGHWNDAYPFVRLHSASANYGVNSTPLGEDTIVQTGLNRGFYEHASAAEICAYFDRVMRNRLLPTGRVRYFPMCNYLGSDSIGEAESRRCEATFVAVASGLERRVRVRKAIVDATLTDTSVPSRRPPKYAIAPGMQCLPPNALPSIGAGIDKAAQYVVIGAGKTGIDTCLWLLEHDVPVNRITWIMPRDSWLFDRSHVQPREAFFKQRMGALAQQTELIQQAESREQVLQLLHQHGHLMRIDERITPPRFRCATVSQGELQELRRITNVVRLGHVQRIEAGQIVLDQGTIATNAATIHVDCTASGLRSRETVPVFNQGAINLQTIRMCQQCFSSALIAHIELTYPNEADKNRLSKPIPLPIRDVDWLAMFLTNLGNQQQWVREPGLREWIANSRLDPNHGRTRPLSEEELALVQRFKNGAGPAAEKLGQILSR